MPSWWNPSKKWTESERADLLARCYSAVLVLSWLLVVFCILWVLLFLALVALNHNVKLNRTTGYQTRAIECQQLRSQHQPIPSACLIPQVKPLWDPSR